MMSTYNQLDLQTLGSQPVMPKNLPDHWSKSIVIGLFLYYALGYMFDIYA